MSIENAKMPLLVVGLIALLLALIFLAPAESLLRGVGQGEQVTNGQFSEFDRSVASIQHEVFVGQPGKIVLILCEENHASLEVQRNCRLAIEALGGTEIGLAPPPG